MATLDDVLAAARGMESALTAKQSADAAAHDATVRFLEVLGEYDPRLIGMTPAQMDDARGRLSAIAGTLENLGRAAGGAAPPTQPTPPDEVTG